MNKRACLETDTGLLITMKLVQQGQRFNVCTPGLSIERYLVVLQINNLLTVLG